MNRIKYLLLFLIFVTFLHGKNEVFFFPKEGTKIEKRLINLISSSKNEIILSMYNLTHKKISKALINAKKKGLKIKVYLDAKKVAKNSKIYKKFIKNKIDVILISKYKLHTKLILFDRKIIFFGSTNFTKDSFLKQYEIVSFSENKKIIKKTIFFLNNYLK